ncbi:hypothetical protein G3574_18120 [Noviherbaspirillum sp. 17J57-3]|uniref:Phosphate ABC transporter substrate-binding protein n=1 Tax=Noviherbaspirillum galbum TaxID=2709383 RepID=A0A6B3SQH2_9BURK|nr:hypothetical protein [Noviherbaspirillum galbum]
MLLVGIFSAIPASADIVIIVNPANPATRMFSTQAAQFFLGTSTMFTPIEHLEEAPIRAEFCKKVLDKDPSQVKAGWSKLVFSGRGKAPQEMKTAAEIKKAVNQNPNAISYIDKSEVDDSVKVVATVQ